MRTIAATLTLLLAGTAAAGVTSKTIEYEHGGTKFIGYLAFDDAVAEKRPGVLVVHEWWGLDDHAKKRAAQLAELGYVAFCPDMYGDGKVTEHPKEAGKMAQTVRMNVKDWQERAAAGLKVLASQTQVDATNLAAIGYCFGGSTCLQLAYTGAALKAVVTFHAALPAPTPEQAKAIKPKIIVCHGADDKFIPQDAIDKFRAALDAAKVDYKFESYPGAVHSFTVKEADAKKIEGMAYNEAADKRSWQAMRDLFKTVFGR
ncbi:MAG TPA: dienelactone hydrolase family protein [Gemmataceae bacterium]|jgi:dienelactone hydrolase|nr:dienelactone hydrolase family protein [Gemmataceae bacterium]